MMFRVFRLLVRSSKRALVRDGHASEGLRFRQPNTAPPASPESISVNPESLVDKVVYFEAHIYSIRWLTAGTICVPMYNHVGPSLFMHEIGIID